MKKSKIKSTLAVMLATVIICLSFTGCIHKHTWVEATCEKPKTCSECGETEGAPLGHTTKFGKCERCGKFIGESIVLNIGSEVDSINTNWKYITTSVTGCSSSDLYALYLAISSSQHYFNDIRASLNKIINLCGDIPELAEIKSKATSALNNIPDNISSSTYSAVIQALEQESDFINYVANLDVAYADILDLISK